MPSPDEGSLRPAPAASKPVAPPHLLPPVPYVAVPEKPAPSPPNRYGKRDHDTVSGMVLRGENPLAKPDFTDQIADIVLRHGMMAMVFAEHCISESVRLRNLARERREASRGQ